MIIEKKYAIALSLCSSPGENNIWNMIEGLPPGEIYYKIEKNRRVTQSFIVKKYSIDPLEASKEIMEFAKNSNIDIISFWDDEYPELLREIDKPPIVLYKKGNLLLQDAIAIVGTRKADERSKNNTGKISFYLGEAGYTIVSGMAIGIDREAHLTALESGNPTVAVLANGIDIIYPQGNRDLFSRIVSSKNSALLSEYPPGIIAGRWTFVRRNRIISGLSKAVVIVKAAEKSGALITARYALEQNREVFVCPGNSFDFEYRGCNKLIKEGAVLISDSSDIIKEMPNYYNEVHSRNNNESNKSNFQSEVIDLNKNSYDENIIDPIDKKILSCINSGEKEMDTIIRDTGLSSSEVSEKLTMLELSGEIIRNGTFVCRI